MKKNILFIVFVLCLTPTIWAQSEFLIEVDEDYSAVQANIIKKDVGAHFIYAYSTLYSDTDTVVPVHGAADFRHSILHVSNTGTLLDSREVELNFFGHDFIPAYGDFYAGIAHRESEQNIGGLTSPCDELILGIVDTNGLSDTTVQSGAMFVDGDCDYHGSFLGMTHAGGNFHILYRFTSGADRGIHLLSVNQLLTSSTKTVITENFNQVIVKPDNSGFYIMAQHPTNDYECRLAELDFDGNVTYLSSYISFATEKDQPYFAFDGTYIYTRPRNFYSYTEVRKYDLSGSLEGTYDSGFITEEMYPVVNGLLVIQRPEHWSGDSKPLKIALMRPDFSSPYAEHEFGYSNLKTNDYLFDYDDEKLTIVGAIQNQHLEPAQRSKDDVYLFYSDLRDLFPRIPPTEPNDEPQGFFFPNPNQDTSVYLRLERTLKQSESISEISFFDVQGRQVNPAYQKIASGLYQISSDKLTNGVYLAVARSGNEEVVSQLLVVDK